VSRDELERYHKGSRESKRIAADRSHSIDVLTLQAPQSFKQKFNMVCNRCFPW
jgi:hypothetical protein